MRAHLRLALAASVPALLLVSVASCSGQAASLASSGDQGASGTATASGDSAGTSGAQAQSGSSGSSASGAASGATSSGVASGSAGSGSASAGSASAGSATSGSTASGSSGASSGTVGVGTCSSDADCMHGATCGFLGADACNTTTGTCFAPSPFPISCLLFEPGCACDGSEISIACTGLPAGYFSKPLRHDGACTSDVGPDSGAVDSGRDSGIGATCSTTEPCAHGEVCGYAGVGVCSDTGSCYPGDLPVCDLYLAGCACDGTAVNTACTGLPTDVYAKPLSHTGACKDGE